MEKVSLINSTLQMLLSTLEPSRERAMVVRWKDEAEMLAARRENRRKILDAVAEGYDTLIELQKETGIPRATCYKLLKRLVAENAVIRTTATNANNRTELCFTINPK